MPPTKAARFFKELNNLFHRSFKKIRINKGESYDPKIRTRLDKLLNERTKIMIDIRNTDNENEILIAKRKIELLQLDISKSTADSNAENVIEHFKMIDNLDGTFNHRGKWQAKKKIIPRLKEPPTAKMDELGNHITGKLALKRLYLKTNKNRLEHRKIKEEFEDIRILKEELWELRYMKLKNTDTEPWTIVDLEKALKSLKVNQCRDPNMMICEIFKSGVAGHHFKEAILDLMNLILNSFFIPDKLLKSDITSIWKNKGSKMDFANDRGIFILSIFRKILDKLLFINLYPSIEKGMSDSNIGARKNKNVRNHLYVVYGVIGHTLRKGNCCVDMHE